MKRKKEILPWIDANQAYLVAQFDWIRDRLGGQPDELSEKAIPEARAGLKEPPAIERLSELFGLNAFEGQILLLSAGVEMDSRLATLCGEAQGHPQRQYATLGLAMATFPEPLWSALTPSRPLRRFRLVEVEAGHGLTSAPLRIDERILHYLVWPGSTSWIRASKSCSRAARYLNGLPWTMGRQQPKRPEFLPRTHSPLRSSTFAATTPAGRKTWPRSVRRT
jgi:hypothetical protein